MKKQPIAPIETFEEVHFGVKIKDPYRWLENWQSTDAQEWLRSQASYTEEYLKLLPLRAELLERIHELNTKVPALFSFIKRGNRYFYFKMDPDDQVARMAMREELDGEEKILFDPNTYKEEKLEIGWFSPSPDGTMVVYGVAEPGTSENELRLLNVNTMKHDDIRISRVYFNGIGWLQDSSGFIYLRFRKLSKENDILEKFRKPIVYLHYLGTDIADDIIVAGHGYHPEIDIEPEDSPVVSTIHGSSLMVLGIRRGVADEHALYIADVNTIDHGADSIPWIKVCGFEDGVTRFEEHNNELFLVSHKNAPYYKIIKMTLSSGEITKAQEVIGESDHIILDCAIVGEYLLSVESLDGLSRLRRVHLKGGKPEEILLPMVGSIKDWSGNREGSKFLITMCTWTNSNQIFCIDIESMKCSKTELIPPNPADFSMVVSKEVKVEARDGTIIPLSIIHNKDIELNGENPVILEAYGAYGFSLEPRYEPSMLAWFERGGILAVAHVRGGGEKGKLWHEAGRLEKKKNSINDMIDCAIYLITKCYTQHGKVAAMGGSAGGITAGGAMVSNPEIWGAIILEYPAVNCLRMENMASGSLNTCEFGTIKTFEGFRGLLISDVYNSIQDGIHYPAILLTTGIHDPSVTTWMPMKLTARIQASSKSGRPVLLRCDFAGGHWTPTKHQYEEELADKLAFLLENLSK